MPYSAYNNKVENHCNRRLIPTILILFASINQVEQCKFNVSDIFSFGSKKKKIKQFDAFNFQVSLLNAFDFLNMPTA